MKTKINWEQCYHIVNRRLSHLLQSDYIRSFDETDLNTGAYKKDIKDADNENMKVEIIFPVHIDRETITFTHEQFAKILEYYVGKKNK